jgi:hypothetical protein
MSAIRYPVAPDAETALAAPIGRAVREREARGLAGRAVAFMTEPVGASFSTREAALDAFAGRVDDDRPGRQRQVAPEDRYCQLREEVERVGTKHPAMAPVEPTFAEGRRWPRPSGESLATRWRLMVSYWRIEAADQARRARRRRDAAKLGADELRAMASQPLRPVRPQQPLDTGLFEVPAPEAPHILIPDE